MCCALLFFLRARPAPPPDKAQPLSTTLRTHTHTHTHTKQPPAITATGVIWSRYSMVIRPKNWNLFAVNVFMAITGSYQLSRKLK